MESEVSDSEPEIGLVAGNGVPRVDNYKRSTRRLRHRTFTQRHVYTVDLCKFLDLESEENLERLARYASDEEILDHLEAVYAKKRAHYDKVYLERGLKRHKFLKPSFRVYVEDFKKYGAHRQGSSFYDTIGVDSDPLTGESLVSRGVIGESGNLGGDSTDLGGDSPDSGGEKENLGRDAKKIGGKVDHLNQKSKISSIKAKSLDAASLKRTLEKAESDDEKENRDLIPMGPSKYSRSRYSRRRALAHLKSNKIPTSLDLEFPDSPEQPVLQQNSSPLRKELDSFPSVLHTRSNSTTDPLRTTPQSSQLPEELPNSSQIPQFHEDMPQSSPNAELLEEVPRSPETQSFHTHEIIEEIPPSSPIQQTILQPPPRQQRSLRHRNFSQKHVYTVDLCAYLGLLTRSELDSYSESGFTDEQIFEKLDHLYEQRRKRMPNLKKDKFKFHNFLSHLEHHTNKYQKKIQEITSSQMISSDASDSEDTDVSEQDEEEEFLVSQRERKRLKGVLPFSYLKLQERTTLKKPDRIQKTYSHVGLARKKMRKLALEVNDDNFIDDSSKDDFEFHSPKQHSPKEVVNISDSSASDMDVNLNVYEPFSVSGSAEEDLTSGIDYMLSRNPRQLTGNKKEKQKASRRNIGTSTWSTKNKRIYNRKFASTTQHIRPTNKIVRDHRNGTYRSGNVVPSVATSSRQLHSSASPRNEEHRSESPEANADENSKRFNEKAKKRQSFYGISPDLAIHSLSRAPKSFTTQLESESHKYAILNSKKLSKANMVPLEPSKKYTIPENDYQIEELNSTFVEELNETTTGFFDLQMVKDFYAKNHGEALSVMTNVNRSTVIGFVLEEKVYTIFTESVDDSQRELRKLFQVFRQHLVRHKSSALLFDDEKDKFFYAIFKVMDSWASNRDCIKVVTEQLFQVYEAVGEVFDHIFRFSQIENKNVLLYLSQLCLLFDKTYKLSSNEGYDSMKVRSCLSHLIRTYLSFLIKFNNVENLINQLVKEDLKVFKSLTIISEICDKLEGVSIWTELTHLFHKFSTPLDTLELIKFIRILKIFTKETNWKLIVYLLKSIKKMTGTLQLKYAREAVNLVFEFEREGWKLDESVLVAVYDLISFCKFKNFTDEVENLKLKFKVSEFHDTRSDSILDSFLQLLSIYIERYQNKGTGSFIEKIMPISDIDDHSDSVLVNRANVLLVYSHLFKRNFSRQLNVLLKNSKFNSDKKLEIAFDATCMLTHVNLENSVKTNLDSIKEIVVNYVEIFNSNLTVRLDTNTIYQNCLSIQKIIDKLTSFFINPKVKKAELFGIVKELIFLKFHATSALNTVLLNTVKLIRLCLDELKKGEFSCEVLQFIRNQFFDGFTVLLGLQLTNFVPHKGNDRFKISKIVDVWCQFSSYLVEKGLMNWQTILTDHWYKMAGSSQREVFELPLYEMIIDQDFKKMDSNEFFLRPFARHIVKFHDEHIYDYLNKLIKRYSTDRIIFANSFHFDSKEQFENSKIQCVISFVYYLKKLSQESPNNFKRAEMLLYELLSSLDKEFEIQNRSVVNFIWFSHFATKIIKFINYSCFELVKNSIEFSQLRSRLNINYHADKGYLEKFKENYAIARTNSLVEVIELVEKEMLSSIIQGMELDLKFVDIFESLVVDQLNNVYKEDEQDEFDMNRSPLYPLTVLIVSHLQIVSAKNSIVNWFLLIKYLQLLNRSILQKGSLSVPDFASIFKMIPNIPIITSIELLPNTYEEFYKTRICIEIYQLLIILFNLLGGYLEQLKFLDMIKEFVEPYQICPMEVIQNQDYLDGIRVLNEEIEKPHTIEVMIIEMTKRQLTNREKFERDLQTVRNRFINLITKKSEAQFLEI